MSAEIPLTPLDMAYLRAFRALEPREQQAAYSAVLRLKDGQDMEECAIEFFVEIGHSPAVARQMAEETIDRTKNDPDKWHRLLD